jgi:hypothetical protein
MPRRHVSTTHIFTGLLVLLLVTLTVTIFVTVNVNAQSNIPTKLDVSSARRTVGVREQTGLRIRLLDQTGNETAASYDTHVTLIATRQKDIDTAKRDGKGQASFQRHGTLALPNGVQTVYAAVTIRQGHSAAAVQFSSAQDGPVRIYAENEKLVTGTTLIAVVSRSGKASPRDGMTAGGGMFVLASMQEGARPPTPATGAAEYQLQIAPHGESKPVLNSNKEYVRKFDLMLLKSGGTYDKAPEDIEVRLRAMKGDGKFSQNPIIIPKNNYMHPFEIEVRSKSGDVEVAAMPVSGSVTVQAAPNVVFDFPTNIRATKLHVQAIPLVAMANGVETIKLRIRPVDDGNNSVRNEDEELEVRNVRLSLASRTLGLRFENGATTIPIKRGEEFIETNVISSYPVAGATVIAEAVNGDRQTISGEQKFEFCFPWKQLGGAMLGGLMFPLVLTVFPGKQREQRFAGGKLWMISLYGVTGLVLGALAFALVFFGALGLTELNFNGIPVSLARLPIHNVLAACAIGFFGGVTLASGIALKERAQEAAAKQATTTDTPAQA